MTDWQEIRIDLKTVTGIITTVVMVLATYFALSSKVETLTRLSEAQAKTIEHLSAVVDAQQHALAEISVTLRLKGVMP